MAQAQPSVRRAGVDLASFTRVIGDATPPDASSVSDDAKDGLATFERRQLTRMRQSFEEVVLAAEPVAAVMCA